MHTFEAISNRYTLRDFDSRKIPENTLERLIEAGLRAPSNDHLRQWEFVVVQNRELRESIVTGLKAPRTRRGTTTLLDRWKMENGLQRDCYMDAIPKQHRMILDCAALIFPCFRMSGPLLKPRTLSSLNGFASIWCCIENILIAASAEGIFGVTRIPLGREDQHIRKLLDIPSDYGIPAYLCLGYPSENARRIEQYPIRTEARIHLNGWNS